MFKKLRINIGYEGVTYKHNVNPPNQKEIIYKSH